MPDTMKNEPGEVLPNASKIKLPEFLSSDPCLWIQICESVFETFRLKSNREKFHVLITHLPTAVLSKCKDVLAKQSYLDLVARLEQLFARNPYEQFTTLMAVPPLQPMQRPSDLLGNMLACIQDQETSSWIFKCLFMQRLPTQLRAHLNTQKFKDLQTMAAEADLFMVSETLLFSTNSMQDIALGNVLPASGKDLCWYHTTYGPNATKCRPPCNFRGPKPLGKASGNDKRATSA